MTCDDMWHQVTRSPCTPAAWSALAPSAAPSLCPSCANKAAAPLGRLPLGLSVTPFSAQLQAPDALLMSERAWTGSLSAVVNEICPTPQPNWSASAFAHSITSGNIPAAETAGAKLCFVLPSVSGAAGFGTLTLFPLSGRTNPAFNRPLISMNTSVWSADVSQDCHSDGLANLLADFFHVVLVPLFVLWFVFTCALF